MLLTWLSVRHKAQTAAWHSSIGQMGMGPRVVPLDVCMLATHAFESGTES